MVEVDVVEQSGEYVLLQLKGDLSASFQASAIRRALERHYVDDGVRIIRVDVSSLGFLDSYGVATLVSLLKESHQQGKRFTVEGARGQVRDKLELTGVLGILEQG